MAAVIAAIIAAVFSAGTAVLTVRNANRDATEQLTFEGKRDKRTIYAAALAALRKFEMEPTADSEATARIAVGAVELVGPYEVWEPAHAVLTPALPQRDTGRGRGVGSHGAADAGRPRGENSLGGTRLQIPVVRQLPDAAAAHFPRGLSSAPCQMSYCQAALSSW